MSEKFNVLSIDGGGIRGIFPAVILAEIEKELKEKGKKDWQIYQNVNLIFGTSTGGILALALSLGIPASRIKDLYFENAKKIFGNRRNKFCSLFGATHKRNSLEKLIVEIFQENHGGKIPLLKDCKVPVAVSVYDLHKGCPSVLKSMYHPRFTRDPNLPLFKAALSTSSAPTYFDPYSSESYLDLDGNNVDFKYKVDGGVWANNPSLIALIEAQKAFKKELKDINLLSIGTGQSVFLEENRTKRFGIYYWVLSKKKRIIELFMQGQSQQAENLISLLKNGIDKAEPDNFGYLRLNTTFAKEEDAIQMDEVNKDRLALLEQRALSVYAQYKNEIFNLFNINNL
ncbi:patatin-like phospholipase family protein [Chryseobacterium sp. S0630]|uniref:CBASS cGAMP-activated phospholipase n=1 Tax=Chryseobacterium sp. S0630 TaxID=2957803 RepID=UPI0020A013E9|nr:CBASS cGAMP-activated phospholipase [Chryseobacterium sp. S0630]MCP1298734.1 patatin-like phospholipase family protein [Chryseobacterium sp. S0630]